MYSIMFIGKGDIMYVVITGASSGIGKELAYLHAKDNYDLVLVARSEETLKEIAGDIKANMEVDVIVKSYDLSMVENAYHLFEDINDLDVVRFINNAGYGKLGHFIDTDLNLELNMLELNVRSLHILTKLYIQHFTSGEVVNVSSMAAFLPTPTMATYAASKSYVYKLTRAINYELKKSGNSIRVLSVNPGPVKTNFNQRANASINRGMAVEKCARIIYKGIKKRKALIIPGALMKITYFFTRITPTGLLLRASYRLQNNK